MMRTFEEWVQVYEKKTNNPFRKHSDFTLIFFPERGFCEVAFEPKTQMVMAYQLCGDGRFWKRVMDSMAIVSGYSHCGAICIRHIKPYIRFFGFRVVKEEQTTDGVPIYYCENADGEKARCAPAWKDTDGYAYYVTWEVKAWQTNSQHNRTD